MGGSSSKHNAASPSSSAVVERSRSYRSRVFQSSCLRSHNDDPQVSDHWTNENGSNNICMKEANSKSCDVETSCCRKIEVEQPDVDIDEWGHSSFQEIISRGANSSSQVFSSRSLDSTSSSPSRCSCLPGNMSFRLHRARSSGSSGALCMSSTGFTVSNDEDRVHGHASTSDVFVNGDERLQNCGIFPACFSSRSSRPRHQDVSDNNLHFSSPIPSFSNNGQHDQHIASAEDDRVWASTNTSNPRNNNYRENFDTRRSNRRIAAQEPIDRNVRFSRTLSVGRLRERSSFLDSAFCSFQQDHELGHASQPCRRSPSRARSEPEESIIISPASSNHPHFFASGFPFGSQDYEAGISRARQARYLDLLEHRSNFLERRRRIRSQARALQRLGSRFQHLSGHERSCILSGQYRTGSCTCRLSTRDNNSNNETTARTSISRIVMLAEALYEVLDEIHQQSVVLSSRASVSPIASVPAPNEIVESLPVKLYSRVQKHWNEENPQCYICLLEYEEGDTVRTLPCHHEFHKTCIDKWLKEIRRVCPLCRGDVCRPQSLASEH